MVARLTQLEMTKRDGVNGEAIFILYAHLEEYSITSGSVSAGAKKGKSWSSGIYKNPENYTTTKFNDKGEPDEKTSC